MKHALPLIAVILATMPTVLPVAAASKPNIIILYADDLGYGDVQCYNRERGKIPTPHIDRLASQGMRFTDGHSSSGVCSPSRYTLLTGRYHWRSRLQRGIVQVFGEPLITPDRMTIGTLAKQHGYRTAIIGKWHLGWDWPITAGQRKCFQPPDQKIEGILPALADRAVAFIGREARTPEPFLLYLPFTSPHTPLAVNHAWMGKSGLNPYADLVMETDAAVGRVLDALDKSGVADNTLVVFTSDNGCAPYVGAKDLEQAGHYPSGPLRGYKSDAWEGGHRVAFMVRWPGVVKPGATSGQLVHQADLLRTIADVLGAELPEDAGEDSFSLLPLLKGEDKPIREYAVSASSQGIPAVRLGPWKYIPAPGSGGWGTGGDQSQPIQLYNLDKDIGETTNLAAAEPERVARMQALLEKLITEGRSTPGAPSKNDVKVIRFPAKTPAKRK